MQCTLELHETVIQEALFFYQIISWVNSLRLCPYEVDTETPPLLYKK